MKNILISSQGKCHHLLNTEKNILFFQLFIFFVWIQSWSIFVLYITCVVYFIIVFSLYFSIILISLCKKYKYTKKNI